MFVHKTGIVETDKVGKIYTYISERIIIEDNCKIMGYESIGNPAQYKETRFEEASSSADLIYRLWKSYVR